MRIEYQRFFLFQAFFMTSNTIKSVNDLINKLNKFKEILDTIDYTHSREDFFSFMSELDKFTSQDIDKEIFSQFYHSKYFAEFKKIFLEPHQYFMRAIEAQESSFIQRSIFSRKNDLVEDKMKSTLLKERFFSKIKDFKLIDFEKVKKVVMVGSGSLPDTLLFLAENFKVPEIIGLDNNAEAVFSSCELINFLGFSNITIKNVDGLKYDYSDADLVYIANFIPPKNGVLEQIAKTASQGVQVLIESPVNLRQLFFEDITHAKINPVLKIVTTQENHAEYFWHKVLKIEKYPDF